MKNQGLRVVLASEYPERRHFLSEVIEQGGRAVIVGEAKDASKALTLTRNLKPDVAVIDCYLPHAVGVDTSPLSRIGGLDIAQTISEESSGTKVILLNNLDTKTLPGRILSSVVAERYSLVTKGADISFASEETYPEALPTNAPIFASIEMKEATLLHQKVAKTSDKVIFFGTLAILGGWFLTITMVFAIVGVPIALAGVATVALGLTMKLTASLQRRLFGKETKQ